MEDQKSGKHVQAESPHDATEIPAPPDNVTGQHAKTEGKQSQQAQITALEDRIRRGERWMIWLTGAIAFFGLCSVVVAILQWLAMSGQLQEMKAGSIDTHALAIAAQAQATAADQFAKSAVSLNARIGSAVEELNLQASAANRLAKATEVANANVIQADRPWMAASISVASFDLGKTPSYTLSFMNSGRRPARVDLTAVREGPYPHFPVNPDREYIYDTTPSTNVVVPGHFVVATNAAKAPLSQGWIDLFNSGQLTFFVFAKRVSQA
ncbi:MAG: hypothetical protein ACR2IV_21095 [Bryobacteraceae bacterium]